jgi:hypothetical protein
MITTGSGYETVLKDQTQFFLKFYFHIVQAQAGLQKFAKKILPRFQSTGSPTCDTSQFSKPVFTYRLLEILLSQKLIFNVQK